MSNFHPLEAVGGGSETELQVGKISNSITQRFNPLNPHGALKHPFESLKNGLISYT